MKRLWADTFGDSREYIDLVFGAYFSPRSAFCIYDGDTLASALLSVPYTFRYTDADGGESLVKTRYLCGLATRPEYRGRGLISSLMDDARRSAEEEGCAFLTLIPASASLRRFYASKGWLDTLPRCEALIGPETPLKGCFDAGAYRFADVREWLGASDAGHYDERLDVLYSYFVSSRSTDLRPNIGLLHSKADFRTILAENAISGGSVMAAFDSRDRLAGLAFMTAADAPTGAGGRGEGGPITRIPYIRMADSGAFGEFLKFAYLRTGGRLLVNMPFSAAERFMLRSLGIEPSVVPYGMLLPLDVTSSSHASVSVSTPSVADSTAGQSLYMSVPVSFSLMLD